MFDNCRVAFSLRPKAMTGTLIYFQGAGSTRYDALSCLGLAMARVRRRGRTSARGVRGPIDDDDAHSGRFPDDPMPNER